MIDFNTLYHNYSNETFAYLDGLYTNFDSRILYSFLREFKPKSILHIAPRQGKITSSIILALIKNAELDKSPINYYLFEKDQIFYDKILNYINSKKHLSATLNVEFNLHHDTNIIDSPLIDEIDSLDFLFIDANHDYILASYLVDKIASKVRENGYIHYHDMHLNIHGNHLKDIKFEFTGVDHEDIIDDRILKRLYPSIYNNYVSHIGEVKIWEGDIVFDYITKNNYSYFSCHEYSQINNIPEDSTVKNSGLYI